MPLIGVNRALLRPPRWPFTIAPEWSTKIGGLVTWAPGFNYFEHVRGKLLNRPASFQAAVSPLVGPIGLTAASTTGWWLTIDGLGLPDWGTTSWFASFDAGLLGARPPALTENMGLGGSGSTPKMSVQHSTSGDYRYRFRHHSRNFAGYTNYGAPVEPNYRSYAGTEATSTLRRAYVDGAFVGENTSSTSYLLRTNVRIGGPPGGYSSTPSSNTQAGMGAVYVLAWWDRVMEADEHAALHAPASRWSLLREEARRTWFLPVAAGGVTLVVSGITQSQAVAGSLALTQANTLAVDAIAQGQTVESGLALSEAATLAVDGVSQSQVVAADLALTQAHVLAVDGITQSQVVETLTLSTGTNLTVDSIAQSQVVEGALGLSQAGALVVDSIAQAQAVAANLTLSEAATLSVDGIAQAQAVEAGITVSVSSSPSLTVASVLQAQAVAAGLDLAQASVLVVTGITQAQALQTLTLIDPSALIPTLEGNIVVLLADGNAVVVLADENTVTLQ